MKFIMGLLIFVSLVGCGKQETVQLDDNGSKITDIERRLDALEARVDAVDVSITTLENNVTLLQLAEGGEFNIESFTTMVNTVISNNTEIINLNNNSSQFQIDLSALSVRLGNIEVDISTRIDSALLALGVRIDGLSFYTQAEIDTLLSNNSGNSSGGIVICGDSLFIPNGGSSYVEIYSNKNAKALFRTANSLPTGCN